MLEKYPQNDIIKYGLITQKTNKINGQLTRRNKKYTRKI
jgi:hypothetical protein